MSLDNTNKIAIIAGGVELFVADDQDKLQSLGILSEEAFSFKINNGAIYGVGSSLTGDEGKIAHFKKGDKIEITATLRELNKYIYQYVYGGITVEGADASDPTRGIIKVGSNAGKQIKPRRVVAYPHVNVNGIQYGSNSANPYILNGGLMVCTSEIDLNFSGDEPTSVEVTFESQYDLDAASDEQVGGFGEWKIPVLDGEVTGINVTAAGSGYTSAPTVTFTGGAGTGAKAKAIIAGGQVTRIIVTDPGAGYTSAPTIGFTGGGGTGATATATIS